MKPVFTVADLEQVQPGGEVEVAQETLLTPLAREEAERRGITIRVASPQEVPEVKTQPGGTPRLSDSDLEQIVRLAAEEILAYLGDPHQRGTLAGATQVPINPGVASLDAGIARLIDHTLLKPDASDQDIRILCREAAQFRFATVCVNPWHVPLAAELLRGTGVKVCAVAGFPLGATLSAVKVHEAEEAIKLGAQEIDMVLNIGALRSGKHDVVESDIRGVVDCCHRAGAICKVILETALLNREQKIIACEAGRRAGADFVKTSTGFSAAGATVEDVALLRATVGPTMGVKAAGGIRSLEDLRKMVGAGATRIGTSSGVKIMEQIQDAGALAGNHGNSTDAGK